MKNKKKKQVQILKAAKRWSKISEEFWKNEGERYQKGTRNEEKKISMWKYTHKAEAPKRKMETSIKVYEIYIHRYHISPYVIIVRKSTAKSSS